MQYSLEPLVSQICLCIGERVMAELRTGSDQLPEQVSSDQRLGRLVQQSKGAHQLSGRHEAVPLLQGACVVDEHNMC